MEADVLEMSKAELQRLIRDRVQETLQSSSALNEKYSLLRSLFERKQRQIGKLSTICQSVAGCERTVKELYSLLGWEYKDVDSDESDAELAGCKHRIQAPPPSEPPSAQPSKSENEGIRERRARHKSCNVFMKKAVVVLNELSRSEIFAAVRPLAPQLDSIEDESLSSSVSPFSESDMQWEQEDISSDSDFSVSAFNVRPNKKRRLCQNYENCKRTDRPSRRCRKVAEISGSNTSTPSPGASSDTENSGKETKESDKTKTKKSDKIKIKESDKIKIKESDKIKIKESDKTKSTESNTTKSTESDKTKSTESDKTKSTESNTTKSTESDKTKSTESDKIKTKESNTTKSTESDKTKTTESNTTKPTESDKTKPTESDKIKTKESNTTKSTESDKTKPTESNTTKPTESDKTKSTESDKIKTKESNTTKPTESDKIKTKESNTTKPTESDKIKTKESNTTKSTESDKTKPTESNTTKPTESDKTKSTESDKIKTKESNTTKPTESDKIKTKESNTTKPTESDKIKTKESNTTKPTESDKIKTKESNTTKSTESDKTKSTESDKIKTKESNTTKSTESDKTKPTESNTTKPTPPSLANTTNSTPWRGTKTSPGSSAVKTSTPSADIKGVTPVSHQSQKTSSAPPKLLQVDITVGMSVLAKRWSLSWQPGKITEIINKGGKVKYKVVLKEKGKCLVSGHHVALDCRPELENLFVGARVVVKWKSDQPDFKPGILAEVPSRKNRMRFLVFADDHTPIYCGLPLLRSVCKPLEDALDDIPDENHRLYMREYLKAWPYPLVTQYKVGQTLNADYNGVQQKCEVLEVDNSLIYVVFKCDQQKEWLYHGSMRLEDMVNMRRSMMAKKKDEKNNEPS
ncbi:histone-lysine N-methyltransferase SETDB1-A [Kryptolebias marmoratus]|uniref:histone-lysine N-methyltransferase SETDB1-A n=1 Tax=Kryptolebias marmoratus TaxID=37003 RepID=UPI0018ACF870|nr:histone-lysine N-methyltransferase SETDB1-A [Kryptolebias marmoratus]